MLKEFKDYFFNLLPSRFKKDDSYKNTAGEGLLERYISIFGLEMDEFVIPFVEGFLDLIKVSKVPSKFLVNLGSNLGYLPSFSSDLETYRRTLKLALALYKMKGTFFSFQMMFNALGFSIAITEILPKKGLHYDDPIYYDHLPDPYQYDTKCDFCSDYYIAITPNPEIAGWKIEDHPETILLLTSVCKYLQPINAKLAGFQNSVPFYLSTENDILITTENEINIRVN